MTGIDCSKKSYCALKGLLYIILLFPMLLMPQEEIEKKGSDPLQNAIKTDTVEINKLLNRSLQLRNTNPDSSIILARQAIELSDAIKHQPGKALGFKHIGAVYYDRGDYQDALDYFTRSLRVFEIQKDTSGISNLQNNIGSVHNSIGDYPTALEYFINSLRNGEIAEDSLRIGTALLNIGTVYSEDEETYSDAIENYRRSIDIFEKIEYVQGYAVANINFGEWYLKVEQPGEAVPYLEDALKVFQDYGVDPSPPLNFLGQAHLGLKQYDLTEKYHKEALVAAQDKENMPEESKAYLGLGNMYLQSGSYPMAIDFFRKGLDLSDKTKVLKDRKELYDGLAKAYSAIRDYENAFSAQQKFAEVQDSIRSTGYAKQMGNLSVQFGLETAEKEIELLNTKNELNQIQIEEDARAKQLFQIIIGLFLAIIAGFVFQYFYIRRTNKRLAFEQNRSEEILLNILPKETAEELKQNGFIKAKEFEDITVLFTDFKAFSLVAERISAENLVKSVDYYFKTFDEITERHGLEKIKTIGDAYMCAGGIPTANKTHVRDSFAAAREILQFVNDTELSPPAGIYPFKIRIGLNSGPVVAGVVGTKKFAYDIWGNTVNIAARMESGSVPGRINVSESIYEELKEEFPFTYRGELKVKNQAFKMYFADVPETIFD
ncbi:MAG: adenylate/guanylate cyclase domain-containing protein [Robiginitalea sp.]|uniref:adenylate/guanylate cyclase domain-containing protein n=1 Tax=Robiginitalea sp. TaxID=1902411 RepID=UPI003C7384D5